MRYFFRVLQISSDYGLNKHLKELEFMAEIEKTVILVAEARGVT
ncbi:hypothetical protein [Scytonema hofmannii]|jgi:hypothetical protein|nr:hypothetical protein [Scytonema hofmannii]